MTNTDGDVLLRKVDALIARGSAGQALALLDALGGLGSTDLWVLTALRRAYEALGDRGAAQKALRGSAAARAACGLTFQAIAELRAALRLHDGNHGEIHEAIADLYATYNALAPSRNTEHLRAVVAYSAALQHDEAQRCLALLPCDPTPC